MLVVKLKLEILRHFYICMSLWRLQSSRVVAKHVDIEEERMKSNLFRRNISKASKVPRTQISYEIRIYQMKWISSLYMTNMTKFRDKNKTRFHRLEQTLIPLQAYKYCRCGKRDTGRPRKSWKDT
jgi:hypothetical protein